MSRNRRHVVKREDGWAVRKEGATRDSGTRPTQRDAESWAKDITRRTGGGEVVIHDRHGRIRDSDTVPPAKDPFPPRDRKH